MAFEIQALVQDRKKSGGFKLGSQLSSDKQTTYSLFLLKKDMSYTINTKQTRGENIINNKIC